MKSMFYLLFAVLLSCSAVAASAQDVEKKSPGLVFVIPLKGEIEDALVYVIRRGVREAQRLHADAIVFDMDTPGGKVSSAEEILHQLENLSIETCTFVNPNAISAGALIALGTDKIFLTENGRIGCAMPIMMSPIPMSGPVEMPEKEREKVVSYVDSLARNAAQRNGHNQDVATAMVRMEKGFSLGDTMLCPTGQLLTLTSQEAAMPGPDGKPLLSSGTVTDLNDLLEQIGHANAECRTLTIRPSEQIARWIESFPVSGILLALAILAIYVEIKTPGFGFPGIAGTILLIIWFWGHHVAGLAGWEEFLLLALGIGLLLTEIFLIPGFGLIGATGIALILAALLLAMVEHIPGGTWVPPVFHIEKATRVLGLSLTLCAVAVFFLVRYLPSSRLLTRITLQTAVSTENGFIAAEDTTSLTGLRGIAETDLRPAGIGLFGDKRLSVVARGDFITQHSPIVIEEAQGNRIVVGIVKSS